MLAFSCRCVNGGDRSCIKESCYGALTWKVKVRHLSELNLGTSLRHEIMNKPIKLPHLSTEETQQLIPDGTILAGYRGSKAHNTWISPDDPNSTDDVDIMSIFVSPIGYYFGLESMGKRQSGTKEKMLHAPKIIWDAVAYEVRKYIWLLLKSNPSALSLLWLRENMYIHVSKLGRRLLDSREIFASKQAYHSFSGYAHGQLHRMEHAACKGIMGEKRRKLVEKYGYDVRNASHLIRLLRMGVEYLVEGELHIFRDDAEELKAIKRGEWTLDKVKAESEKWFNLAHEAYLRSPLPSHPDREKAEKLAVSIVTEYQKMAGEM
jgi:predicted nucleotidyltransferase